MAAAKSPLFAFWQHSWQQFADFARATPARMFPIEIRSYAALVGALVARRDSLGIAQETVDAVAGFSDRYTAKIEAGTKRAGKVTLGLLLGALGLKLTVSEDREALKRVRAMFKQRTPKTKVAGPCTIDREEGWPGEVGFAPEALVEECRRLRQELEALRAELDALRAGAACALPKPPQPRRKAGRKKARRAVQRPEKRSQPSIPRARRGPLGRSGPRPWVEGFGAGRAGCPAVAVTRLQRLT